MSKPMPSFPAFDEWQKMSEREQDALITKMEGVRNRSRRNHRVLLGLSCALVTTAVVAALYVVLLARP